MQLIKMHMSENEIYAVSIFGKFLDFRQWYYLYDNGKKSGSWFDVEEVKYAIIRNNNDIETRIHHNLWFKPIPKIRTIFRHH
jgi:hypothetical protein